MRHAMPFGRHHQQRRVVWGVFFILIGVLALLNNLQVIDIGETGRLWPTVFCAIGVSRCLRGRVSSMIAGLGFFLLGVAWTMHNLGLIHLSAHLLLPLLLILAGIVFLSHAFLPHDRGSWRHPHRPPLDPIRYDDDVVDLNATMSGVALRCDSQDFKGGELKAMLGGIQLDLRQASMASLAELRVSAVCGGIQIRIPLDWLLKVQVSPMLGGVEDKTIPPQLPSKTLLLSGEVMMGGIEIKN